MCWQISRFTDIFSQVGVSPVQKQTQVSPSFTGNTGVLLLHNIIAHVKHTKDISCTRTYTCVCFNYIFVENGVHTKKKTNKTLILHYYISLISLFSKSLNKTQWIKFFLTLLSNTWMWKMAFSQLLSYLEFHINAYTFIFFFGTFFSK